MSMLDILCNLNNEVKIKIVCFLHPTKCLNMYDMLLLIFGGRVFWGHFFYLENSNICSYQPSFSLLSLKDGLTGLLERQRFIK